jgi:hypothetical protein
MRPFDRVVAFVRIISAAAKGDKNAILANVALFDDDDGNPAGGQDEQPVYGAGGVYLCPDPPDDDGVCAEGISLKEEDGCTIIAMRDLRLTKRIPSKVGSVGIAHYGGGFIDLSWDADHAGTQITILAPRLDGNGEIQASHGLLMDPTSGNASVILMHQLGNAVVLNKDGDAMLKSANGKTWISATNDGFAMSADGGIKFLGGVIAGNTQTAKEVALHQQVLDLANQMVTLLTALALAPVAGSGAPLGFPDPATLADFTAKVTALSTLGKATTLKASPV